jgi:hypothetical protein
MEKICLVFTCVFLILLSSCTTQNSSRPSLPAKISLNVKIGKEPMFLKLHLETGEELPFAFDTGSPITILDKSLETKLGKRLGSKKVHYGWKENGQPSTFGTVFTPILLADLQCLCHGNSHSLCKT